MNNKKIKIKQHENIEFIVGNAFNLPFTDNAFNLVLTSNFLDLVDDIKKFIPPQIKILNKQGLFLISFGALWEANVTGKSLNKFINIIKNKLNVLEVKNSLCIHGQFNGIWNERLYRIYNNKSVAAVKK